MAAVASFVGWLLRWLTRLLALSHTNTRVCPLPFPLPAVASSVSSLSRLPLDQSAPTDRECQPAWRPHVATIDPFKEPTQLFASTPDYASSTRLVVAQYLPKIDSQPLPVEERADQSHGHPHSHSHSHPHPHSHPHTHPQIGRAHV